MKRKFLTAITGIFITALILIPSLGFSQNVKDELTKYFISLPSGRPEYVPLKYRMTALYINRDLYGNFTGKTKVTGDYTSGLEGGYVKWNNVFISGSDSFSDPFPTGVKQEYMENIRYKPSNQMLEKEVFKDFPSSPENVLARNMIWDMMTFDTYAWDFSDSLMLNKPYATPGINEEFDMAEIGKYKHNSVFVCWKGISEVNGEICSVIDFNATDNILELELDQMSSKGTEQYWGTVWVSMKTKNIEQALMYSGTIQEIDVTGFEDKFLVKTIRELWVEKIK